jgi:PAS domain-containing protein
MTRAPPCADLVRTFDWSTTALGPYAQWPERLKGYVAMVLAMPRPAIIFWGPTQIQIYNDGYGIIMGPRHPRYFGATYQECWPDTYPVIYPWMQRVLAGEVIEVERSLFVLTRYGFTEEAYFTFTFSPLLDDDDRIQGILQPVVEVTREVIADRRAQALRELEQAASGARSVHDAVAALDAHPKDIPFALLYRVDADGALRLAETCGLTPAMAAPASEPASVVARAFVSREVVAVAAGAVLAGEPHVGTWDEPTRDAFVLPVTRTSGEESRGVLVCGLSPRLAFDDAYRNFMHAITRELATLIDVERARAAGHELEQLAARARAQAEAERRRLHAVFENAPVAITIVTGANYVVELANPRALAMWERSLADVHGKPVFEALPELEGQGLRELLDEVRATGKPFIGTEVRTRLRGADGQLR